MAVAILLIVAGIATQSYGDMLIKAKTSRVKAEFRTISAAISSYAVDHNSQPRMSHFVLYRDPSFDQILGVPVNGILSRVLTTPVAYVTSINRLDPFMTAKSVAPLDEQFYTYQVLNVYRSNFPESDFWPRAVSFYGDWRLGSVGPDQVFDHGFANSAQLPYDPSNGTISFGNIWYSPNQSFGAMPPVPELLGKH